MPNNRRAGVRVGKNPPKDLPLAERRRRAAIRRLKSQANSQQYRVEFMRQLIAAESNPARKRYFAEELEIAQDRRRQSLEELKRLKAQPPVQGPPHIKTPLEVN